MSEPQLPLLALFTALRDAGLPLGADEYLLLVRALQAGFGIADGAALRALCQTLWASSREDQRLLDYHFDRVMAQAAAEARTRQTAQTAPAASPVVLGDEAPASVAPAATPTASPTEPAPLPPALEDEVQALQVERRIVSRDTDLPYGRLAASDEYFPLTRRQMKQRWRAMRRLVRAGPPIELDIAATIDQIGRQGLLSAPVLMPQRVNRTELLLLLDQDGSMVPFHALGRRLADTAARGGRLGRAGIYFFHNSPAEHLYHDPALVEAVPIEQVVRGISQYAAVLIFSDAGAARGGHSPERVALTRAFLRRLGHDVRYIAWLNPMPRARWKSTSADEVARMVQMFPMTRRGLGGAIDVLRGRRPHAPE